MKMCIMLIQLSPSRASGCRVWLALALEVEQSVKGRHRSPAPVETKGKLVQVGLEMMVSDLMMSPAQSGIQIPEDTVNQKENHLRTLRLSLQLECRQTRCVGCN